MNIGAFSRRTACPIETVRYYERIGIIQDVPRTASGYRVYGEDHVRRLSFIRRARALGFTLKEVRELLALVDEPGHSCEEMRGLAQAQLDRIRARMAELAALESVLDNTIAQCAGGDVPQCPIFNALTAEGVGTP